MNGMGTASCGNEPLLLFGAPVGLYTGKIRSYLRKQGIAYQERLPSDAVFQSEVLPVVRRFINPVIRLADGTIVQDTADIIDHFEVRKLAPLSAYPQAPLQRLVALVLDLYGGEGLIRPAMHYRWSYRTQNEAFLRHEFGLGFRAAGLPEAELRAQVDGFMAHLDAHLPRLGITAESAYAIEASYEDLLARLDKHLRQHPYLLGGQPTLADYGLIAPLYAHLARDPYPASLMKTRAPGVFRWTERMLASDADMPEFPGYAQALPEGDAIPATLQPVLALMAKDYLPELRMVVSAIDAWLRAQPAIAPGAPVSAKPAMRTLTQGVFQLRGTDITAQVYPYTLYKLQRVTDCFAALPATARQRARDWFAPLGLADVLTLQASRRVERQGHIEVWGLALPR